jgi:hypothetical protein
LSRCFLQIKLEIVNEVINKKDLQQDMYTQPIIILFCNYSKEFEKTWTRFLGKFYSIILETKIAKNPKNKDFDS